MKDDNNPAAIKLPVKYVQADQIIRDGRYLAILSVIGINGYYGHGQQIADALNADRPLADNPDLKAEKSANLSPHEAECIANALRMSMNTLGSWKGETAMCRENVRAYKAINKALGNEVEGTLFTCKPTDADAAQTSTEAENERLRDLLRAERRFHEEMINPCLADDLCSWCKDVESALEGKQEQR